MHATTKVNVIDEPDPGIVAPGPDGPIVADPTVGDPASPADSDRLTDDASMDAVVPEVARRRHRRRYVYGTMVGLLLVAVIAANFVRLPYYVISPGSVRPTQDAVRVEGRPSYDDAGEIGYTTISSGEATAWSALVGWLDPARDVFPTQDYLGDQSHEDSRKMNLALMDSSKQTAEVVALRQLGYEIEAKGSGAVIHTVVEGSPADSVLEAGDTVVAVDDQPVGIAEELVAALGTHRPGDEVTLTIDEGEGRTREERVTLSTHPDDAAAPFLGVAAGTRDIQFDLPFEVSIDSGDVGGPSAGLAFTLATIDVLTPGSLTGGSNVAVTGTIRLDGSVGPIGGIRQKVETVKRHGSRVFLVPAEEYDEAMLEADGLQIVPVHDIDEALQALGSIGGDVEVALGPSEAPAG